LRLSDRQVWSAHHGLRQRRPGGHRLGDQLASPIRSFDLYLGAAIGGIGAGVIYGASVGNALEVVSRSARPRGGLTRRASVRARR
jgi:hypothetical protein